MALGLLPGLLRGQNLVPNPDFEQLKQEPCQFLQFPRFGTSPENISAFFEAWYTPTGGTADPWTYDTNLDSRCTQNLLRYRIAPRSGRACLGLFTSSYNETVPSGAFAYREYAQVRLRQPMKKGYVYKVAFYARLHPSCQAATNNLGAYFSMDSVLIRETSRRYGTPLNVMPQVNEGQIVADDGTWRKIEGCFVADDAYRYLTLGNFFSDARTARLKSTPTSSDTTFARPYYLIDDVSVEETTLAELPRISLGPDTTLCPNQRLTLRLPTAPTLSYRWQDGSTAPTYTIGASGEYRLETVVGACVLRDTLRVTVEKAPVLPPDTVLCRGETLVLRPATGTDLVWSSGSRSDGSRSSDSRGPTFTVSEAGTYTVQIPSRTCLLADTLRVEIADCPGPVPNVFTPNGDGRNDTFFVENIDLAPWHLRVFNRWGTPVYDADPYRNEWTGDHQPAGTYYYELTSRVLKRALKGWVQVLR